MSREIELKIPLSSEQYKSIESLMLSDTGHPVLKFSECHRLLKSDEYYSRFNTREDRIKNNEPKVIRIRCEKTDGTDEKAWFTIKNKTIENGIEYNEEQETFIENPQVLRNMFAQTGFNKWFSKIKEALSCFCAVKAENHEYMEFHAELEKVNGLPYLEIEYTKDNSDAALVKKELENLASLMGADPAKKDSRSWIEIINGKENEKN